MNVHAALCRLFGFCTTRPLPLILTTGSCYAVRRTLARSLLHFTH